MRPSSNGGVTGGTMSAVSWRKPTFEVPVMLIRHSAQFLATAVLALLATACSGPTNHRDAVPEANAIPHLEVAVVMTATQPSARPLVATISVRNAGPLPWVFMEVMPVMMEGWQVTCTDAASHSRTTALWHQPEPWACAANPSRTLLPGATISVQALVPNPGMGTWMVTVQSRVVQPQAQDERVFRLVEAGPASLPVMVQVVDDDQVRAAHDQRVGQAWAEPSVWAMATAVFQETRFLDGNDPGWWLVPLGSEANKPALTLVGEPAFRSTMWISARSLVSAVALLDTPLSDNQSRALSRTLAEVPRLPAAVGAAILRWLETQQGGEREPEPYYSDRLLAHLPESALVEVMTAWRTEPQVSLARRRLVAQIANASLMHGSSAPDVAAVARDLAQDVDGRTSFLALSALTWTGDVQAGQTLCDRLIAAPGMERTTMGLYALTALPQKQGIALLKRYARLPGVGWWADGLLNDRDHWPRRWP